MITFLVAIRTKHGFDTDWLVPNKYLERNLSSDGFCTCLVLSDHWRAILTTRALHSTLLDFNELKKKEEKNESSKKEQANDKQEKPQVLVSLFRLLQRCCLSEK